MAERQTTARPYAEAVFAHARERDRLGAWSATLAFLAAVAADENMTRLAVDPRLERERFRELFLSICGARVDAEGANFVRLLIENRRLSLLPEIVTLFEQLKAAAEARIEASVVSAFALEPAQIAGIEAGLKRRFGRDVHLTAQVDPALVGGIVIRAGDLVIDGSVRSRLAELATYLRH